MSLKLKYFLWHLNAHSIFRRPTTKIYFIFFYFGQIAIGKFIAKARVLAIKATDGRVRTMTEILNSMKLIKMYAWEESFEKKIAGMKGFPSR